MEENELLTRQLARMNCICNDKQKSKKEFPVCIPCRAKRLLKKIDNMTCEEYKLFLSDLN